MFDREITQLIVGIYRQRLATQSDHDDCGITLDLIREAEAALDN